ncbi:MAG TPA: TldD/PmbA family protein [Ktedonobacterales bacterium]|nr:TldD/PmbA family protein [Ktedonobacterales bacterium]
MTSMRDEQDVRALCERILHMAAEGGATQAEVLYTQTASALTRFAVNSIHQNVAEENEHVSVRAVLGNRIGVVGGNQLDDNALRDVVRRAIAFASVQPENPDFTSLPGPAPIAGGPSAYSDATAAFGPEERAARVGVVVARAVERGFEAAGAFETSASQLAIANSLGVWAHQPSTEAEFHAVIMADGGGSGWAQRVATDATTLDFDALAAEAVEKAERGRHAETLPVGEYPVVLESYAVAEMLQNLAFMGLSALALEEERSPFTGRMGQTVAAPSVTIYDDAFDPAGLPRPFDYEGAPTERVSLVDRGVASAVVYDSFSAHKEGKPNTGHALPAPNTFGAYPEHLMMAPGDATREELIGGIERGVYVTRFHYTNIVHPVRTLFTGMTRDGTFLIEHGAITRPVKNFRFTQSIWEALAGVEALGRERVQSRDYVTVVAPAARLARWNFTGLGR